MLQLLDTKEKVGKKIVKNFEIQEQRDQTVIMAIREQANLKMQTI